MAWWTPLVQRGWWLGLLVTLPIVMPGRSLANFRLANEVSLQNQGAIDRPICYFQTSRQQVINLDRLCQGSPGTVSIANLAYQSNLVLGRVDNQSRQTVTGVRIHYQVIGEQGNVIEQNSVEAMPATLQPGQTATFETVLPARTRLINPYVTWTSAR